MSEQNRSETGSQSTGDMNTMYGSGQGSSGKTEEVRQAAGEAVNTAKSKAKETAGAVAEGAKQTADQAKQALDDAARQTKNELSNVTSQVRQQADALVSEQKNMAAERLGTLAQTLRQSGQQLQEQDESQMGRYADVVADQVESLSEFLRNRNPGDMLGDLQRLARRQPEMFVAGSLAVGFLIGRFIKGPSRAGMQEQQYNPAYYGQGGYQSGYQGSGYESTGYQGGGYESGSFGSGGYQGGYEGQYQSGGGYTSGGVQRGAYAGSRYGSGGGAYRGSDNPAEGAAYGRAGERRDTEEYEGRFESSGFQGNAYQQGGQESSGYQAEGADPNETSNQSPDYLGSYEGGRSAYQTGPTGTEGSDTDYPRYDPNFSGTSSQSGSASGSGSESGSSDEGDKGSSNYSPSSRR